MLKTRIITALFLAAGLFGALFWLPAGGAVLLFIAIVVLGGWEWAGILKMAPSSRWLYGIATGLPCLLIHVYGMPRMLLVGLWSVSAVFWLLLVPLWFRHKWPLRVDALGLSIGWLLLIPSWAAMTALYLRSPWWLLAAMALVWVADIAAYFVGRACGRRKLAPTISPGKTWEGAMGAVAGVLLYGLVLGWQTGWIQSLDVIRMLSLVAGLLVLTAVSIVGDLFESLAKRQAGIKDSSALLPGHGGVLDRIDSLTSTLPLVGLISLLVA